MPIKLPKTFARRKSSGNALDELENPPEPSFKVFERPSGGSRSFDGPTTVKRMSVGRPLSTVDTAFDDNIFAGSRSPLNNRGSGGTNNSASTGGLYESSASSARYSSTSTLPSSTDVPITSDSNRTYNRSKIDLPVPPIAESQPAFSVKAAGRTFSFGMKGPKVASPGGSSRPNTSHNDSPIIGRDRAMTASTASTATPPKLLDSDFEIGGPDLDGFGNMFEGIGNRSRTDLNEGSSPIPTSSSPEPLSSSPAPAFSSQTSYKDRNLIPAPINIDRSSQIESSPYSWGSHDSREGLINSPSPLVSSYHSPIISRKSVQLSNPTPLGETSDNIRAAPKLGGGIRRSSAYLGRRKSTPIEDEDARLVNNSTPSQRRMYRQDGDSKDSSPSSPAANPTTALFDSEDPEFASFRAWREPSPEATPRPKKANAISYSDAPTSDTSFVAHAKLAAQYEQSPSKPTNKVMTPAQFERYKQQQEALSRTRSNATKHDGSEDGSENEDDDDETERNRKAAQLRQKQEAHLSVYRQQMMKVTGENSNSSGASSVRPSNEQASLGTPDSSLRFSTLGIQPTGSGKSSGDEEDEDVPLGILAAHGFPNKHRPPTRLASPGSMTNLRSASQAYPPPPSSVAGESSAQGPRGNLPVFARNLPQDPYFGAGLVNPSNRESLAMSGGASTRGPASAYGAPQVSPHPAGLVGVIAGEERARAMRRGSPNAQGGYDQPPSMHPGMPRSQTMGAFPGMPPMGMPGMPPMLTPGDQAQIQMSHQMTQMMQMQMQWMQQMQQMMAGQGMPPGQLPPQGAGSPQLPQIPPMPGMPPMGNNFLAVPGQAPRPSSMPLPGSPRADQRSMSMLEPGKSQWNRTSTFAPSVAGVPGYAPSLAPSERSNVGMASRYRPVSIAPDPQNRASQRASTFTSGSSQNWALPPQQEKQSTTASIRPVSTVKKTGTGSDDDDDDEGWAEMQKRKEKKRSNWKMKKGQGGFQDLYHSGM